MRDRCYCPDPPRAARLTIQGEEAHHLARVRRVGAGNLVEVFDGQGTSFEARVLAVGRDAIELEIVAGPRDDRRPSLALTLATAIPKGERFDWLVEKTTELGVARLVPLLTARSVVDPRASKLDRLRRSVVEACKQSGRNQLMRIDPPMSWPAFLRDEGSEPSLPRWVADPTGPGWDPASLNRLPRAATLAIGPEGGFSPAELAEAQERGWTLVGLGPTILRVETAGVIGCGLILIGGSATGTGRES